MEFQPYIKSISWHGIKAVEVVAGGYEMLIVPGIGGNLIRLKDNRRNLDIIRTPRSYSEFVKQPEVFGIPVLFFPNRIQDGTIKVDGMVYNLPVNEKKLNNHLHGFLYNRPWEVIGEKINNDGSAEVEMVFNIDPGKDIWSFFPHHSRFRLIYNLSRNGLQQHFEVINHGREPMPFGLGFHTNFNIPFRPDEDYTQYKLIMSIGRECEMGSRALATGNFLELSDEEKKMRETGILTQGRPISGHFSARPLSMDGRHFNGAIIKNADKKYELIYEVGDKFRYWVIWNHDGKGSFISVEPQTMMINAPNIKLPYETTGFVLLPSGSKWYESCNIRVV
ncbi:MAG: aldose 1-epimerase [Clostridiaceae bacterium]|nr:aldose 1-epimerase [Clostridiaceae bacterium]